MADASEPPGSPGTADLVWQRLEDQLRWYRTKSRHAQTMYKRVKLGQIVVGAIVPVIAGVGVPGWVTASAAAAVLVAEGAQQLFQWHSNWLLYRSAAEQLKHESFLYLAQAGPYGSPDRHIRLAERIESVMAEENATWATQSDQRMEEAKQLPA